MANIILYATLNLTQKMSSSQMMTALTISDAPSFRGLISTSLYTFKTAETSLNFKLSKRGSDEAEVIIFWKELS